MIKAILFDSGRVLNYPASGHWFISPKFFEIIDADKFGTLDKEKKGKAFWQAGQYINNQKEIKTLEEEFTHFCEFYRIFAETLPELKLSGEQVKELAMDLVYNTKKYTFFEDALEVIPKLKSKYKLAIVSDAWPSLKNVYEDNGMYEYFGSVVISSILGIVKPDSKMYQTALDELGVLPREAIFVDDSIENCKGALKLGIKAFLLCRDKREYLLRKYILINRKYKVINNLKQLR